jgi:FkbM family methyltransferase
MPLAPTENGLSKYNTPFGLVGPTDSEGADFYVTGFNFSSSGIPFDSDYPFSLRTVKRISATVVRLESLILGHSGKRRINLLKIDIEGREADLLAHHLV